MLYNEFLLSANKPVLVFQVKMSAGRGFCLKVYVTTMRHQRQ